MRFKWNFKPIPPEHHPIILKGVIKCIENTITSSQRKRFEGLKKVYPIERAIYAAIIESAQEGKTAFVPGSCEDDIPEDICDLIYNCYGGVYEKYCDENNL